MRFADGISSVDDCIILQNDLNSVYDWASCNNMSFNSSQSGGFRPKFILKKIFTENHDFQSTYMTYIALLYLI